MPSAIIVRITQRQRRSIAALIRLITFMLVSDVCLAAQANIQFLDQGGQALGNIVVWPELDRKLLEKATQSTAGRTEIDQRNKRFDPYVSVMPTGTEVFFPNSDDIRHHVYSFSDGNAFERKLYRANEADPVSLKTPGIVALGCNIHDNMQAYVVVSDELTLLSDPNGQLSIPKETTRLRIWHPLLAGKPLETSLDKLDVDSAGNYVFRLPFTWSDPQTPRSEAQLESLLKQFSRDPK